MHLYAIVWQGWDGWSALHIQQTGLVHRCMGARGNAYLQDKYMYLYHMYREWQGGRGWMVRGEQSSSGVCSRSEIGESMKEEEG
jgi:hypothetical protein